MNRSSGMVAGMGALLVMVGMEALLVMSRMAALFVISSSFVLLVVARTKTGMNENEKVSSGGRYQRCEKRRQYQ